MRIIAFIVDLAVIDKILRYLSANLDRRGANRPVTPTSRPHYFHVCLATGDRSARGPGSPVSVVAKVDLDASQ